MPRLDGLELTKRLRERYDKARLPIVLVSVMSEEEDIVRGFEAGANDYLVKPYRAPALAAKVAVLLRERDLLTPHAAPFDPICNSLRRWRRFANSSSGTDNACSSRAGGVKWGVL